jgi:2-dehydropantoate 2-reductase
VLQNGVEHIERFSPFVARDQILPVVVDCPVERSAPGQIVQRRDALLTVPDADVGRAFRELFTRTRIQLVMTDDFLSAAWAKLCLNSVGAVSAVVGQPSKVIQVPGVAELMDGIARECVAVARAEGARLRDDIVETVLENCRQAPPDSVNSLLADRLAGRPMEIEARNGVIVRRGAGHGIPTPFNQAMVALLRAVQANK